TWRPADRKLAGGGRGGTAFGFGRPAGSRQLRREPNPRSKAPLLCSRSASQLLPSFGTQPFPSRRSVSSLRGVSATGSAGSGTQYRMQSSDDRPDRLRSFQRHGRQLFQRQFDLSRLQRKPAQALQQPL